MQTAMRAESWEEFGHKGLNPTQGQILILLGHRETGCAYCVLFLFPRTAFIAAILLATYLGGATATHVRKTYDSTRLSLRDRYEPIQILRFGEAFCLPILIAVAGLRSF